MLVANREDADHTTSDLNPIALRQAIIAYNFGFSEYNRLMCTTSFMCFGPSELHDTNLTMSRTRNYKPDRP